MPFDTRKILLKRFLARRARQRAASVARAKENLQRASVVVASPDVVVPAAFRKYKDTAVRRLIGSGKRRGYVTFEEVNDILPALDISVEEIEVLFEAMTGLGFEVSEC
jgi:hypothetical protein